MMRHTLEELLSKDSLEKDIALQSMMDDQYSLPISAIFAHDRFKSSHPEATEGELVDCLLSLPIVQVDAVRRTVRPLLKAARCTLILHSIPPNVTADQVCMLFKTPVSVKPDVNNTWFVTFNTERACLDAAFALQKHSGTTPWATEGPIACCIKTTTPLRRPMATSAWGWSPYNGAHSSTLSFQEYQELQNLPPLDADVGPPATATYSHGFRKYERADIIAICDKMTNVEKPHALDLFSMGRAPFGEFEGQEIDPLEFILAEPLREWAEESRRPSSAGFSRGDERDRRKSPHASRRKSSGQPKTPRQDPRQTPQHGPQKTPGLGRQSNASVRSRKSAKSADTQGSWGKASSDGGVSWAKKMRNSLEAAKVDPEEA
eukprot:GEMP01014521.1.p1 GENE.GEMP01014521.1~~GEMP01014521.1.p1  ORF type:complete len:375 (+),score=59.16 GEMP01014521.1:144-1268(+)